MIIADTSSWVDHFRGKDVMLGRLLVATEVLLHPFVFGELLLYGLPRKGSTADLLTGLDQAPLASIAEVAAFIGWAGLADKGIGYVDTHLLVSAKMLARGQVLTLDRKLHAQAERLGLAYQA